MASRGEGQLREHIGLYFGGFKFPEPFKIEDLPHLWKAQKLDTKYNVMPVFAPDNLVEFHYLKPDIPEEPVKAKKGTVKAPVRKEDDNDEG